MTVSPLKNLFRVSPVFHYYRTFSCTTTFRSTLSPQNIIHSHLTNKPILINRSPPLSARQLRRLGPHLLHILQHHVAVAVKSLDARQQLAVVAARDEDLGVRAHGGLEDGERTGCEFMLLEGRDFELAGVLLVFVHAIQSPVEERTIKRRSQG